MSSALISVSNNGLNTTDRRFRQCVSICQSWACWRLISTKHWLLYISAAYYYSDNWKNRGVVIRKVFLYHQAPKGTRWLVAFLICRSTSLGSFTTNGVRLTVTLCWLIRLRRKDLVFYRWYDIFQCPWPGLFDFELLETDHRPVREKVFKLLRQTAITYGAWAVCITFLASQTLWK